MLNFTFHYSVSAGKISKIHEIMLNIGLTGIDICNILKMKMNILGAILQIIDEEKLEINHYVINYSVLYATTPFNYNFMPN